MQSAENDAGECPTCWGDGYLDSDLGRETCTRCWGSGVTKTVEGVGTGAGEGATGQDTGTAWVTRSEDCPEAPAQAHPLGPDGFTPLVSEGVENARRAEQAERRAEDAEVAIEAARDLLDGWEHDGPDDYAVRLLIQRVRETLALGERFRTSREGERS